MDTPRTPHARRIVSLVITLVLLGLAFLGWLWLRAPQPPSGTDARNGNPAGAATSPDPQATAGAASGEKARDAQSAAVAGRHGEQGGKLANLDTRGGGGGRDDGKRQRALAALRAKIRGVEVQFDPITGAPDHIMAAGRFLTGKNGRAGDALASVREFVDEFADLLRARRDGAERQPCDAR